MATTTVYVDILSRLLGIPVPTITTYIQRLREDETLFRRGKQGPGAIEPTAAEIANLLIALCATPSTGRRAPNPLDVVRTARAAIRLTSGAFSSRLAEDIAHFTFARAETFGEALEALIADMRDGTYAEWKGDDYPRATVRFLDHGGRIFVNLQRQNGPMSFVVFRNDDGDFGGPCLNQIAELDLFALEAVGQAMRSIVPAPA
ncbi:hypothetical protein ABIB95_003742 [Bradyrhizobium sp. LA2.1]